MSFRKVYSNFESVSFGATPITGVEEISMTEDATRVSAAADNELHESVQFIGTRSTQIELTLQEAPPFTLTTTNTGTTPMDTLIFTLKGRMGATDRSYSITGVQWFNVRQNGAHGNMRRWQVTGHAVTATGGATPVTGD